MVVGGGGGNQQHNHLHNHNYLHNHHHHQHQHEHKIDRLVVIDPELAANEVFIQSLKVSARTQSSRLWPCFDKVLLLFCSDRQL